MEKAPAPAATLLPPAIFFLLITYIFLAGCTAQEAQQNNYTSNDNAVVWHPDTISLEQELHTKINVQREKNGLPTLAWDEKLAEIARKHSEHMADGRYFDHLDSRGLGPTERADLANYSCIKKTAGGHTFGIGENIFKGEAYASTTTVNNEIVSTDWKTQANFSEDVVDKWMHSPEHRANIVDAAYDREGIGVAIFNESEILVTEDFC